FFPASWLTYSILRKSLLPSSWAIIASLLITFFSPQILRITGYYGLAYPCFVPLLWYALLIAMEEGKVAKGWLIYGVGTVCFGLLHPYYAMIGAAFLPLYLFVRWLQYRKEGFLSPLLVLGGLLAAIGPGMLLRTWELLTSRGSRDVVEYPYGFLEYIAGFETIFVPQLEPLRSVWDTIIPLRKIGLEGNAHVGLVGLIILFALLWRMGQHIRDKKFGRIWRPVLPQSLQTSLWVAGLILIPAMAHPFQWFPGLLEWLGPLQQFRAIGRLAWVFHQIYLVFCVWYVYALFRILKKKGLKQLGGGLVALGIISVLVNIAILNESQQRELGNNHKRNFLMAQLDVPSLLEESGRQAADFQAIIALPYFHFGSEKILAEDWPATELALTTALQTGLPMCNNRSARASLSETLANMQLVSHPLIPKELPTSFPDERPLLLLYWHGAAFSPGEKWLVKRATSIVETERLVFAELPLSAFEDQQASAWQTFEERKDQLWKEGETLLSKRSRSVLFDSFGDDPFQLGQQTQHAEKDRVLLFDGRIPTRWPNMISEVSFWVQINAKTNYLGHAFVEIREESGQVVNTHRYHLPFTKDVQQDWVKCTFTLKVPDNQHRIILWADDPRLTIDNLLIRPNTVDVYLPGADSSHMLLNNYFLSR
ncbi:MAG: hypothetical protein AAF399_23370, partial [Bacteroidota bacterium]